MKQGFSLGMDVTINEEGQYDASISYLDTDDNEIRANAQGENIEEVCWDLYDKLSEQVAALEEEKSPEDMTDEEYIAYLEEEIERLRAEKNSKKEEISKEDLIKQIDKTIKYYDKMYNTYYKKHPYFKYAFSW